MHANMYIESKGTGLGFPRNRDVRFSKFVYDDLPKTDIVIIPSISPWTIHLAKHAHDHRKSFMPPSMKLPATCKVTNVCPDLSLGLNPAASLNGSVGLATTYQQILRLHAIGGPCVRIGLDVITRAAYQYSEYSEAASTSNLALITRTCPKLHIYTDRERPPRPIRARLAIDVHFSQARARVHHLSHYT